MRRRKRITVEPRISHDRWMISYADFVTLLFAFFVVMFSTANSDKDKAREVAAAVSDALSGHNRSHGESSKKPLPNLHDVVVLNALLRQQLHDEIAKGEVELSVEARGLTVSFKQAAVFDSGEALVKESAIPAISKVADAILKIDNEVRLEGHTDNVPIHNSRFNNNWELSSARSIAILQIFTDKFGVPVRRLAVSGYADVLPVASNDTEAGRARNRRVDVVILSSLAASRERRN